MSASLIGHSGQAPNFGFVRVRIQVWVTLLFAVCLARHVRAAALMGCDMVSWLPGFDACFVVSTSDINGFHHAPRPDRDEPGVSNGLDHTRPSAWNGVLVIHMRCRMTASLRATATSARRLPLSRTIFSPQVFKAEGRVDRSSKELAAV